MLDRRFGSASLLAALLLLPAIAANAAASDVTVTDAKIAGGKLVVTGTTAAPNTWVRLDGQAGAAFNVKSDADGAFAFALVYHPGDCIVGLQKLVSPAVLGDVVDALVANCGPSGVFPRGAWIGTTNYRSNDLVTSLGSTWRAKRSNANKPPATSTLDWEQFAAAGAPGPSGPRGPAGPAGSQSASGFDPLAPPTGPAGGDLAGTYPNPSIRAGAVTSGKIALGAVTGARIAENTITTTRIAPGAIATGRIANNAVTSAKILDATITAADLAPNSVGSSEIATDAVGATEIADNSIDSGEIVDFSLSNQDIGVLYAQVNANGTLANSSGGVTSTKIGAGTYEVDFGRNVSFCAFIVTQGEAGVGGAGGAITGATDRAGNVEAVFATTRTDANVLADRAFQLVVVC